MRTRTLVLVVATVGCKAAPDASEVAKTDPHTSLVDAAVAPKVDESALQKEAQATATATWLRLSKVWQGIHGVANEKKGGAVKACTKTSPPGSAAGLSIGSYQVGELAKAGAPHNALFSGGGTTSMSLTDALKIPFLENERRSRDWDPKKAAAKLAEIEKALFPLTVLRIDDFVAPELTGAKSFRAGHASTTAFFFESQTAVCSLRLVTNSDKSVSALTLGGETGGPDIINARLSNDLEQSVQRAAGVKLASLGKLGSLEPVVPAR
jgi:hypothetical protein